MSLLFLTIATLIKIIPYVALIFLPFRKFFRHSLSQTGIIAFLFIIFSIASSYFMLPTGVTFWEWRLFYLIIISIFGLLLAVAIIKSSLFIIIFNFFVVLCYTNDIDYYSLYLQSHILNDFDFGTDIGAMIFCNLLILSFTFPFMWLFMTKLMVPLVEEKKHDVLWRFLWVIPFSFYFLYKINISSDYLTAAFMLSKSSLISHLTWSLTTFLSFATILKMLQENTKNEELNHQLETADLQLKLQHKEYQRLNNNIDEARKSKHDLRQHFVLLKHFLHEKDLAALERYLNNYIISLDQTINLNICANTYCNAIIQYYYNLALAKKIKVDLQIELPENLKVAEEDISILLGNILENALEACERQAHGEKFIFAKAAIIGNDMLALTVKNSFDHEINQQEGNFISSKRAAKGIGTSSIQSVAERYDGIVKFSYADGVFETSVLLPNS